MHIFGYGFQWFQIAESQYSIELANFSRRSGCLRS